MRQLIFTLALCLLCGNHFVACSKDDTENLEELVPPAEEQPGDDGDTDGDADADDGKDELVIPEGCTVINRASEGRGIDIVIVGDGFTARDVADGKWDAAMDSVRKYIFFMEPYTSHRQLFNVYATHTAYDGPDLSGLSGDETVETEMCKYTSFLLPQNVKLDNISKFAYENTPVKQDKGSADDMFVMFLINSKAMGGGWCSMDLVNYRPGRAAAVVPFNIFWRTIYGMFAHELMGHGIGHLCDEYIGNTHLGETFPEGTMGTEYYFKLQVKGDFVNVTFTTDPDDTDRFKNRVWAEMLKSGYHGLKTPIEGAVTYPKGVWRATENSIMVGATTSGCYFNPVQREAILRRLYKLAGMEQDYSLDVFYEYDKINEDWDKEWVDKPYDKI